MVWAIARTAPSRAYLEFEDHPLPSVAYTFSLETKIKINIDTGIVWDTNWLG